VDKWWQRFLDDFHPESDAWALMKSGANTFPSKRIVPSFTCPQELFRKRFQAAIRQCVRHRFSVAECFGVIWMETLEEIALSDHEQSVLYEELLCWAKYRLANEPEEADAPGFLHQHAARLEILARS
jgi:hypothetical protein